MLGVNRAGSFSPCIFFTHALQTDRRYSYDDCGDPGRAFRSIIFEKKDCGAGYRNKKK